MCKFYKAMVTKFEDWHVVQTTNGALKSFLQGSSSVLAYNAQFRSMAVHALLSLNPVLKT